MGNSAKKQNQAAITGTQQDIYNKYSNVLGNQYNDYQAAKDRADTGRNQLNELYSGPGGTGVNDFMGMTPNTQGWYDLPSQYTRGPALSAGASAAGGDFGSAKRGYQGFADTGNAADFAKASGSMDTLAQTGGVDTGAIIRGETTMIPAFYDQYKAQTQARANTQGGYSPGFDAQQALLAREAGQQGFNAMRVAQSDATKLAQQGLIAGAEGQAGIAGQISGNRLAGLGGLTNIGGLEQQNNQFNAGLAQGNNQFNAGATNQYDTRNLASQMQLLGMGQQGRQFAAGQKQQLFGTDVNQQQAAAGNMLSGIGGLSQSQLASLQLLLANNKGIDWSKWAGVAGNALPFLGKFFPGGKDNNNANNPWAGPTQVDENGNPIPGANPFPPYVNPGQGNRPTPVAS
jgi:hypothetical protein